MIQFENHSHYYLFKTKKIKKYLDIGKKLIKIVSDYKNLSLTLFLGGISKNLYLK